jgi:Tfp pilus assembly protein PilO
MKRFIKKVVFYLYVGDYSLVYFSMLAFSIVILGYLGIVPGIRGIIDKQQKLQEYTVLEEKLKEKESRLFEVSNDLRAAEEYLPYLEASLPTTNQTEDFLSEFTQRAAESGFRVNSFKVLEIADTNLKVLVELQGDYLNLPNFIRGLNNMNRVALLETSNTRISERSTDTDMTLVLYFMEEPAL